MRLGQRKPSKRLFDPVQDGSPWQSLVSPLAMAAAFALMIAGLFIGSCDGD